MGLRRSTRERVGKVEPFPVNAVPAGWYECLGGTKTIAGDPALYAYLGTRYGGDGVTTFGLPDYQDMVLKGLNRSGARTVGDYEPDKFPSHTHGLGLPVQGGSNDTPRDVLAATDRASDTINQGMPAGCVGSTGVGNETTVKNKSVVWGIKR